MINREIGYACIDCYLLAHDSSYNHPIDSIDHNDISMTDWTCTTGTINIDGFCMDSDDETSICSNCESSGTGYGITVGGICDLGGHKINGYWEYREYLI